MTMLRIDQVSRTFPARQGNAPTRALEPTEGFLLSRVDGALTAADICALSVISEDMTCRVLYGLVAAGIIGYEPQAPPRAGRDAGDATRVPPRVERPVASPPPPPPAPPPLRTVAARTSSAPRVEAFTPESSRPEARDRETGRPAAPLAREPSRAGSSTARLLPWQEERAREIDERFRSLEGLNLYAVLGLARDAPSPPVAEAWKRLSEKFQHGLFG